MRKTVGAALLLMTVGARADSYYYDFATDGRLFWRPASGANAILYIGDAGSVTLKTRCYSSAATFVNEDGKAHYGGEHGSSNYRAPDCIAERPAFENLKQMLSGVTGLHATPDGIVLEGADGQNAIALVPVPPDGIEFRRLTVTAFRYRGKLLPLHDSDFVPDFVLYDGEADGSSGCGGFFGDYKKLGPSQYKFALGSILAGMCNDIKRALWRVDKICRAFDETHNVEARGQDFILRDKRGRAQMTLSPLAEGKTP